MKEEKRWISSEALFSAVEELLAENRQAIFTVTGMSMWPFLCHGRDQAVVEHCNPETLKKGDIVLFQTVLGNYMLHRVTGLEENRFETTGDGNCFRDGWFSADCAKARAVTLIRKGQKIDCRSPVWKLIFHVWMFLFPVRKYLLCLLVKFSRWKNMADVRKAVERQRNL